MPTLQKQVLYSVDKIVLASCFQLYHLLSRKFCENSKLSWLRSGIILGGEKNPKFYELILLNGWIYHLLSSTFLTILSSVVAMMWLLWFIRKRLAFRKTATLANMVWRKWRKLRIKSLTWKFSCVYWTILRDNKKSLFSKQDKIYRVFLQDFNVSS